MSVVGDSSNLDESRRDHFPSLTRWYRRILGGGPNDAVRLDCAKCIRLLFCQTPTESYKRLNWFFRY